MMVADVAAATVGGVELAEVTQQEARSAVSIVGDVLDDMFDAVLAAFETLLVGRAWDAHVSRLFAGAGEGDARRVAAGDVADDVRAGELDERLADLGARELAAGGQ